MTIAVQIMIWETHIAPVNINLDFQDRSTQWLRKSKSSLYSKPFVLQVAYIKWHQNNLILAFKNNKRSTKQDFISILVKYSTEWMVNTAWAFDGHTNLTYLNHKMKEDSLYPLIKFCGLPSLLKRLYSPKGLFKELTRKILLTARTQKSSFWFMQTDEGDRVTESFSYLKKNHCLF